MEIELFIILTGKMPFLEQQLPMIITLVQEPIYWAKSLSEPLLDITIQKVLLRKMIMKG